MKNVTSSLFKILFVVLAIGTTAFFQSCSKNDNNEAAPVPNIVDNNSAFFSNPTIAATVSTSLLAYWPLAANAYDLSGNKNNGEAFAVKPIFSRDGNANAATYFNNIHSCVTIKDTASLRLTNTDFTISAWVNMSAYIPRAFIINKGGADGWGLAVSESPGDTVAKGAVIFVTPNGDIACKKGFAHHQWRHIVVTYTIANKTLSFYLNGVLQNKVTNVSAPMLNTSPLYIGQEAPNSLNRFNGYISDVRIYNRAISFPEIDYLYGVAKTASWTEPAFFPLTHVPNDLCPNKYQGTLHNIAYTTDRFGNPVGAAKFNGTSSNITVDNSPFDISSSDFSLNAWVKITAYDPLRSSILNRSSGAQGFDLGITNTGAISFYTSGGVATSTKTLALGRWYLVTVSYYKSSSTVRMFINGSIDKVTTGITPVPNENTLIIGAKNPASSLPGGYFNGIIGNIHIYNSALASAASNYLSNSLY